MKWKWKQKLTSHSCNVSFHRLMSNVLCHYSCILPSNGYMAVFMSQVLCLYCVLCSLSQWDCGKICFWSGSPMRGSGHESSCYLPVTFQLSRFDHETPVCETFPQSPGTTIVKPSLPCSDHDSHLQASRLDPKLRRYIYSDPMYTTSTWIQLILLFPAIATPCICQCRNTGGGKGIGIRLGL